MLIYHNLACLQVLDSTCLPCRALALISARSPVAVLKPSQLFSSRSRRWTYTSREPLHHARQCGIQDTSTIPLPLTTIHTPVTGRSHTVQSPLNDC
ncbi:hypothetical protein KCU61_g3, partial [Aureobasidium melanogenum]